MTRTDVHAPSSPDFDPQKYVCYGVFDLFPEVSAAGENQARMRIVNALVDQGYRFGGSEGGCGHCGVSIRYAAIMARADVMEMIYVGEDCLEGRFEMTQAQFQVLRESNRLNRDRMRKSERKAKVFQTLAAEHPTLAFLAGDGAEAEIERYGWFVADVLGKAGEVKGLSERQVAAVVTSVEKSDAKTLERALEAAYAPQPVAVPTEILGTRTVITGEVVARWERDTDFGLQFKMKVRDDRGFTVSGTEPSSLQVEVGQRVSFTAKVEPHKTDATHAWYTRPTKAVIAG